MSTNPDVGRYGSGQVVRRIEDPALLAGRGQYAGDVTLPGQTWLVFVRSPFAHARINGDRRFRSEGRFPACSRHHRRRTWRRRA